MNTYSLPEPVETTLYDVDGIVKVVIGHQTMQKITTFLVLNNLYHSPINKQSVI